MAAGGPLAVLLAVEVEDRLRGKPSPATAAVDRGKAGVRPVKELPPRLSSRPRPSARLPLVSVLAKAREMAVNADRWIADPVIEGPDVAPGDPAAGVPVAIPQAEADPDLAVPAAQAAGSSGLRHPGLSCP